MKMSDTTLQHKKAQANCIDTTNKHNFSREVFIAVVITAIISAGTFLLSINTKIAVINQRIETINSSLVDVDKKFDKIDHKLDTITYYLIKK